MPIVKIDAALSSVPMVIPATTKINTPIRMITTPAMMNLVDHLKAVHLDRNYGLKACRAATRVISSMVAASHHSGPKLGIVDEGEYEKVTPGGVLFGLATTLSSDSPQRQITFQYDWSPWRVSEWSKHSQFPPTR